MHHLPMLANILAQPRSLGAVLTHHTGPGARDLSAAARLLQRATGRILISGMGASFFAAMPAAALLEQHGRPILLRESSELLHFGSGVARPGDLAILISRSGASAEVVRLAERLRSADVSILGITNFADSPLAALSDATVLTTDPADNIADQIVAVQSYTATLLTMLLLAEDATTPGSGLLSRALASALGMLPALLDRLLAESESWEGFLSGNGPLYLLGRGPALASVHEGSLLFHETAKLTAMPLSSGQFRHGPVEAISQGSRAIVIGTPDATHHLDASLATDLLRMGADVRWIGPAHGALPSLGTWFDVPAPGLLPLFEIFPLQIAAFRCALWRGLTPGDFRYGTEVTSDETGFPLLAPSAL